MSDLRSAALLLAACMLGGTVSGISGCASSGDIASQADTQSSPAEISRALVEEAGTAFQSGDTPLALDLLEQAAHSDPESAEPWLRLAQVHFDGERFPAAIIAAREALARDAEQRTAQSIAAVSALRIARDQLSSLREGASLHGSVREEAQMLTNEMRQTLSEDFLVPRTEPGIQVPAARPSRKHRPARKRGEAVARSVFDSKKTGSKQRTMPSGGDPFNPFQTLQSLPQ